MSLSSHVFLLDLFAITRLKFTRLSEHTEPVYTWDKPSVDDDTSLQFANAGSSTPWGKQTKKELCVKHLLNLQEAPESLWQGLGSFSKDSF